VRRRVESRNSAKEEAKRRYISPILDNYRLQVAREDQGTSAGPNVCLQCPPRALFKPSTICSPRLGLMLAATAPLSCRLHFTKCTVTADSDANISAAALISAWLRFAIEPAAVSLAQPGFARSLSPAKPRAHSDSEDTNCRELLAGERSMVHRLSASQNTFFAGYLSKARTYTNAQGPPVCRGPKRERSARAPGAP
jgi:hypothetical protein